MMNWRRPLLSLALRVIHPVTARELALLRRLDRAPAAEIRRVHEQRLEALLRHAYGQTDYYREILGDLGVVRGDGREVRLGEFERIPILTKDVIRAQGPRLRAKTLPPGREAYVNRTGGSTGQPVEYWQDNYYWGVNVATKLYHFKMLGKRLGEPELKIWGSDRDLVLETGTAMRRVQNLGYNRRIVTCGALRPEDIEALIVEVNRFRPKSVWGYIDALYTIAEYVNRTGRKLHSPGVVLGGGGTMFPQMRESIRRAFKAPVINFYGSREMGDVACECARMDGLHVSSNSHKVEVVDAAGRPPVDGEDGDLILTALHNYAMPFIRYRIGDRGCLSSRPCACGRGFPTLKNVSGRGMEAFVRADEAVISPIYLITSVGGIADSGLVRRIQFVQEDYDRVLVKLVPDTTASEADIARWAEAVRGKFRAVMGPTCEVRVERVADIPPTDSGKYLYTISKVKTREPALAKMSA